VGAAT
jgi:integrase